MEIHCRWPLPIGGCVTNDALWLWLWAAADADADDVMSDLQPRQEDVRQGILRSRGKEKPKGRKSRREEVIRSHIEAIGEKLRAKRAAEAKPGAKPG
jgi:hypothetical protein